jgi:cytochrome d ubiquinol oxidase subunit I
MTVGAFVVLRSMARRWNAGDEDLPSPYGPAVLTEDRTGDRAATGP